MKLLMFMRDALPPSRVDVAVLFDKSLRQLGIQTDYVGHRSASTVPAFGDCVGHLFETGPRFDPRTLWRELKLVWRRATEYDMVVVRDKPLVAGFLFAAAALRRRRCVYWMSFPIPLGDRVGGRLHWGAGRWVQGALTWLRGATAQWVQDRFVLPRASHVFVQSQEMLRQVMAETGLPKSRISAVPMGIDSTGLSVLFDTSKSSPWPATVIAYLGSLDRARQLDVLVDAFAQVLERHANASLLLVGWAPRDDDVAWLKSHAASLGVLDRIVFTGALPMAEAWERVREASVCVSPVPPGPLHDVSSPTKVVEYLALGMPVVASDIPDQRLLLEACGGGVCVAFTAEAFSRAITAVLDDLAGARARAQQARTRVLALRSYDVLGGQVAATLRGAMA